MTCLDWGSSLSGGAGESSTKAGDLTGRFFCFPFRSGAGWAAAAGLTRERKLRAGASDGTAGASGSRGILSII